MSLLPSGTCFSGANGNTLRKLKPVLDKWIELVDQYSKTFDDDSCYWYSERSNVGILAAAAWGSGKWIALEEYPTTKNNKDGKKKYGRCDLYLANIRNGHELSFAIEAKHTWSIATANNSQLGLASADAATLDKDEAAVRVAACFVAPGFLHNEKPSSVDFDGKLEQWLDEIKKKVAYDGLAWVFPKSSRELRNKSGKLFPGVCLLLNVRRRGNG